MVWEIVDRRIVVDSPPWLRVVSEKVRLPNGIQVDGYWRVEQPAFVVIFAVTRDSRVPFVTHYRHGPRVVSLDLPAGYIHEGEAPEAAAARELIEETGLTAEKWLRLGDYYLDGNRWCGQCHFFLATEAMQVAEPNPGDLEEQSVSLVALAEVRAVIGGATGIQNLSTVAAALLALDKLG